MRLPQRVPWTSLSQLEQLCGYIYNDGDWEQAISRLFGWKFTGSLPFALEATLSLLVATQVDTEQSTSSLSRRNGYALAIVRFINGLVDPLQSGPHARSIAAIAIQIGIPLSLVELRHAATHEELPSLVALRQAAREALAWLLNHYFLPTLSQSPVAVVDNRTEPPSLDPLLKDYKRVAKALEKDSSLARQLAPQLAQKLKAVESWIVSVKANHWHAFDGDPQSSEIVALEYLSAALAGPGGLVPISKKRHPISMEIPTRRLWQPFLQQIQTSHPSFASVLVRALIDELTLSEVKDAEHNRPRGRFFCLAGWLLWVSTSWVQLSGCDPTTIVEQLLLKVWQPKGGINELIDKLTEAKSSLRSRADTILAISRNNSNPSKGAWTEGSLGAMQARIRELRITLESRVVKSEVLIAPTSIRGWRRVDPSSWRPRPIGS